MTTSPDPGAGTPVPETVLPTEVERRLHPLSWLFVLLTQLRQFLVPLVALLLFGGRASSYQMVPALVAVVAIAALSVWRYFTYRYRIGSDSIFVRSGLFERSLRQVPFSRIHDVAVHQSLLHRIFEVAEVRLESASGDKPEARMQVLRLEEALALERLVRRRGEAASGDAPAAAGTDPGGDLLLALPTPEVVRLGLVSNRGMVIVAGAFALSWQVLPDRVASDVFADLGRRAAGYADSIGADWLARGLGIAALVLVALLLVRLLSVALALVQYHDFRLEQHGRRLTAGRGLLTRRRNSVPRRRIQAWTLQETLLHRLLGRRSLRIDTAVVEQGNEERGLAELAPIATPQACDALVEHLLPQAAWPPPAWQPLHPRAWIRLALGGCFVALLLVAAIGWRFGAWGLLGLLWIPWAAFVARQHARRAGYALDDQLVAVREGWWSRHWRFAELDKLQALQLRQSPLDRWFGMASLWLDSAGTGALAPPLRMRYLPEDEARALLARIGGAVARRRLRW
ncbi:PH domain-containing protein [Luteimonas sp. RD2P54]|uniref:PH domain-containing protein n=1 Tax=Luteimonas endophytica TaxID=3042023 RepID=A0ABT6J579_9GAMM|nr:PH domain-containing protein [Luteimonas endophytica]MDH5821929.1 PH domain-containing protein [Luteimonas endophytica]